jgi:signal transduction histidine kinase
VAKTDDSAPSYININQELERIILLCNNILDKCIGFSFKPYGFEPPILYMPATSFEQLIMNLVVNAAHSMTFMRDMNENIGGVVTISVKSVIIPEKNQHHWTPGKYFKIDVIDEGVGIDTHKLKYIFDPFYTSKPEGKGTGIGLAAVKDILNRQKGYIDVESDVGKGTVFSVYLPALKGNA